MDRKEFLNILIQKYLKPFFLIGILSIFIIPILFSDIETKISTFSFILFLTFSISIAFIVIYLVSNLVKRIKNIVLSKLSDKALHQFSILNKIFDYLSPIIFGIFFYHAYQRDKLLAISFFGVYMLLKIRDIIKQENIKIKNT
jgi:hypothetical protein